MCPRGRPGATEAELDAAGRELGVTLPPAFRALYRCHDGQELRLDRELDSTRTSMPHKSMLHGILGGCDSFSACQHDRSPAELCGVMTRRECELHAQS